MSVDRCKFPHCGEPLSSKQAALGNGYCARHAGQGPQDQVSAQAPSTANLSPTSGRKPTRAKGKPSPVSAKDNAPANLTETEQATSKTVTVGVRLTEEQAERLANLAQLKLATTSALAREAIIAYLAANHA